jgi:hypothetical protein
MANKHTVELNDKELLMVWSILAWFQPGIGKRLASGALVRKFSGLASDHAKRNAFDAKFEKPIQDRIIELGKWLGNYQAEEAAKAEAKSKAA